MTQLFRPILDEDGNPTGEYEAVQDVFKEVVVHDARYKKATDDAYNGRQTIKSLEEQLGAVQSQETEPPQSQDTQDAVEPNPIQPEPAATITEEERYQQFKQRLLSEQSEVEQAKSDYQAMVNRVGKENNVNPALLRGDTEEAITQHAQLIAKEQLKFRDIGATPDGQVTIDDGFWNRVDSKLGWGDDKK